MLDEGRILVHEGYGKPIQEEVGLDGEKRTCKIKIDEIIVISPVTPHHGLFPTYSIIQRQTPHRIHIEESSVRPVPIHSYAPYHASRLENTNVASSQLFVEDWPIDNA